RISASRSARRSASYRERSGASAPWATRPSASSCSFASSRSRTYSAAKATAPPPAPASTRPWPITSLPAPPDPATAPTTSAPPESAGYEAAAEETTAFERRLRRRNRTWGEAGRERAAGPLRPSEGGQSPPPRCLPARSRRVRQDAARSEVAGRRAAGPADRHELRGGR